MNLQKLRLGQLKAAGTTVGDLYFPQTKLLLPFEGTNGATTTSDLSNLNNAATFNGNASISTARSKFGGSSCYFDGTGDYVDVGGTYWTTGAAIDSGDFTIELWLNIDAWGGNDHQCFISNYGTGSGGWGFYVSVHSTRNVYHWHHNGSGWVYVNYSTGTRTPLSLDTWHHIAFTRSGNIFRLFLDGTQEDSLTDSNAMTSSNAGVQSGIRFGALGAALDYPVNGYMDDVRITKGVARYTSNFTPPTSAHLTSAGDVNKQIIVNSAADGVAIGTGGINQARIAKAWVNFNGTGTVAINGSYNVSSITDDGVGDYDINFSTALSDTNYVVVGTTGGSSIVGFKRDQNETRTTSKAGVYSLSGSQALADGPYIEAIVFGN